MRRPTGRKSWIRRFCVRDGLTGRIIVDKPDLKGRVDILKVHSKDVHMDETVDLEAIALATSGAVGSDLANMINEAAINAVKARPTGGKPDRICLRPWKWFLWARRRKTAL